MAKRTMYDFFGGAPVANNEPFVPPEVVQSLDTAGTNANAAFNNPGFSTRHPVMSYLLFGPQQHAKYRQNDILQQANYANAYNIAQKAILGQRESIDKMQEPRQRNAMARTQMVNRGIVQADIDAAFPAGSPLSKEGFDYAVGESGGDQVQDFMTNAGAAQQSAIDRGYNKIGGMFKGPQAQQQQQPQQPTQTMGQMMPAPGGDTGAQWDAGEPQSFAVGAQEVTPPPQTRPLLFRNPKLDEQSISALGPIISGGLSQTPAMYKAPSEVAENQASANSNNQLAALRAEMVKMYPELTQAEIDYYIARTDLANRTDPNRGGGSAGDPLGDALKMQTYLNNQAETIDQMMQAQGYVNEKGDAIEAPAQTVGGILGFGAQPNPEYDRYQQLNEQRQAARAKAAGIQLSPTQNPGQAGLTQRFDAQTQSRINGLIQKYGGR